MNVNDVKLNVTTKLARKGRVSLTASLNVIGHVSEFPTAFNNTESKKLFGIRTLCAIALRTPSSSFNQKYIPYEARVNRK